jgi:hypothetical protein
LLVCWADGTNESSTKRLTFQVFFFIISYRLRAIKTLYFHFCNFIKNKRISLKGFLQRILQHFTKRKMMLGSSDAWSTKRLPHRPSEPVYYILDWWISNKLW